MALLMYLLKVEETPQTVEYQFGTQADELEYRAIIDKATKTVTPGPQTPQRDAEKMAGWVLFQMKKQNLTEWPQHGTMAS